MKFDDLYKKVFISEEEDKGKNTEVASPEDFDDVEPMPLPELDTEDNIDLATDEAPVAPETSASGSGGSTLKDYVFKIEEFANVLNGTDGDSLAALVASLDKPETPFEGISSRTSSDIISAAKTLREVVETLKNFLIHSLK